MRKELVDLLTKKYQISVKELSIIVNELHSMGLRTTKERGLAISIAVFSQLKNIERTLLFIHKVNDLGLWKRLEMEVVDYDSVEVMKIEAKTKEDIEDYKMEQYMFYSYLERTYGKLFLNCALAFYNNYGVFEEIMMDIENENI